MFDSGTLGFFESGTLGQFLSIFRDRIGPCGAAQDKTISKIL